MRTTILIVIALLMSGCGLIPRTGTPSEALTIADAMSIPATDIPKAKYADMTRRNGVGDGRNIDNNIAGAAQMAATGDPTMFLLGGFTTSRSVSVNIQYAAWVPEELATNADEAVEISKRKVLEAAANVYAHSEKERQEILASEVPYILSQPYGEGSPLHAYVQLYDLIADHSPSLVDAPSFMTTRHKVYGPIFIGIRGGHTDAEHVQKTLETSGQLPDWFYIYSPGYAGVAPRSIMNQGKQYLFIEP